MIKKLFLYAAVGVFLLLVLFVGSLFYMGNTYSNNILKDVFNSKFEDDYQTNLKYLHLIKKMVDNKKTQLNNYYKIEEKEKIFSYIKSTAFFTKSMKDGKALMDYLSNMPIDIKVINEKLQVISGNDILSVGQTIKLPCNPITEGTGMCEVKTDKKICTIIYEPQTKLFIMGETKLDFYNSYRVKEKLYNFIKLIPNIVIYKNKKDISKLNSKNFYILRYDDLLDIFYGIKINSLKVERFAESIVKNIKSYKSSLYINIFFLLGVFIVIVIVFYTFFYKKIETADNLYTEYKEGAKIDKMTGVYNRYGFEEYFKTSSFAKFALIDLDNFKYINDNFGHNRGDLVLKKLISYLKEDFQHSAAGRWGGDEFMLLTSYNKEEIRENIASLNKKLFMLQKSFDKNLTYILSVSMGVVDIDETSSFEVVFKKADLALYKVKKMHKGNVAFYEDIEYVRIEKEDL